MIHGIVILYYSPILYTIILQYSTWYSYIILQCYIILLYYSTWYSYIILQCYIILLYYSTWYSYIILQCWAILLVFAIVERFLVKAKPKTSPPKHKTSHDEGTSINTIYSICSLTNLIS